MLRAPEFDEQDRLADAPVNDLFGHKIGDNVLRLTAVELRAQPGNTEMIARLGGDEFALLFRSASPPEAEAVIYKLRISLSKAMMQKTGR